MKESYSDFSIIKDYIELKAKYDSEIKNFIEASKGSEEKFKKHVAALEAEIIKRNEYIKAQEAKIQELTQKGSEKDEQLKTLGLQLHKMKLAQASTDPTQAASEENSKKGKFGLFK